MRGDGGPVIRVSRQVDFERRASTNLAFDVQETAVALDDGMHGRETEAGAQAELLGREERFEDPLPHFGRNADARVGHLQYDMRSRLGRPTHLGWLSVDGNIACRHGEHAAARHGITGVDREIEQHLMQLRRIAGDRPKVFGGMRLDPDVTGKSLTNDPVEIIDQMVQPDSHLLAVKSSGKGQNLTHQVGSATATGINHVEGFAAMGVVARVEFEQFYGHHYGRKHIVEIVGDAAGECSDALHALGALVLSLYSFLLGKISHATHHPDALASRVAKNITAILHEGVAGVLALDAIICAPGFRFVTDSVMDAVDYATALIGMNAADPG